MSLRETLLQILSADRRGSKPELIEHGTILLSPPHSGFHLFFHVRDDADIVVRWTATHASQSKSEPISMAPETRAAIAQSLASVSALELALATTDRPLRRIDEARFSGFEAFAIAHPSLNPKPWPVVRAQLGSRRLVRFALVHAEGLEPPRLAALEPKSGTGVARRSQPARKPCPTSPSLQFATFRKARGRFRDDS